MGRTETGAARTEAALFPTLHEGTPRCAVSACPRDVAVPPATRTETRARSSLRAAGRLRGRLGGTLRLRHSLAPPVPRLGAGRGGRAAARKRQARKIGTVVETEAGKERAARCFSHRSTRGKVVRAARASTTAPARRGGLCLRVRSAREIGQTDDIPARSRDADAARFSIPSCK
jgi:hypothetical protein